MDECIKDWKSKSEKAASETDLVTTRMLRTVYTEVVKNIALDSHADIVQLQKLNGINMGVHHYERTSATRIMDCIAEDMLTTFIDFLKSSDTHLPLSILVDTTTDASTKNYLAIYFRTLENNLPRIYFYDLILVDSEKAEAMKELIVGSLKRNGIYDTVKNRIVGFASDGASVMMGNQGGLGKLLGDEFGKKLYRIHCAPHKLQLAIGHSYEEPNLSSLLDLEKTVNAIYSFYNRNAVKRKASLRNTAESFGETLYELNYIFKVRWVSSEYEALRRINQNYIVILTNLEEILVSPEFARDTETLSVARNLFNTLQSIRFRSLLLFMMDVLNLLKTESLRIQSSEGTLIGMEKFRKELVDSVEHLKTEDGPAIALFLRTYKCFKDVGRLVRCSSKDLD